MLLGSREMGHQRTNIRITFYDFHSCLRRISKIFILFFFASINQKHTYQIPMLLPNYQLRTFSTINLEASRLYFDIILYNYCSFHLYKIFYRLDKHIIQYLQHPSHCSNPLSAPGMRPRIGLASHTRAHQRTPHNN